MSKQPREIEAILVAADVNGFVDELFAEDQKGYEKRGPTQQAVEILNLVMDVGGEAATISLGLKAFLDIVEAWRERQSERISATLTIDGEEVAIGGEDWNRFVSRQLAE